MIEHIYVIGDEKNEPERINYLKKYFEGLNIRVSYFQPTFMNTLTESELSRFTEITHDRLFKASEKSLFLNFLYLFQKCVSEHTGNVLILESDVIFEGNLSEYLFCLQGFIKEINPDIVSIGSGCDLIHDDVDTNDMNLQIYKYHKLRCADSLIFSVKNIQSIISYVDSYGLIDEPFDNFIDKFIKDSNSSLYWAWPSITMQGSQEGKYRSLIQNTEDSKQTQVP